MDGIDSQDFQQLNYSQFKTNISPYTQFLTAFWWTGKKNNFFSDEKKFAASYWINYLLDLPIWEPAVATTVSFFKSTMREFYPELGLSKSKFLLKFLLKFLEKNPEKISKIRALSNLA